MKEEEEIRQNVVTRVSTKDNTGLSNHPNEGLQSELLKTSNSLFTKRYLKYRHIGLVNG